MRSLLLMRSPVPQLAGEGNARAPACSWAVVWSLLPPLCA